MSRPVAALVAVLLCATPVLSQHLIDRVLARVAGRPITLSDVRAVRDLGVVEATPGEEPQASALRQVIERRLLLAELSRAAPMEPLPAAIEAEVVRMRGRAGDFEAVLRANGLDLPAVREMARETLRIEAYLRMRYGAAGGPRDLELRQWLNDLRSRAQVEIVGDVGGDQGAGAVAPRR